MRMNETNLSLNLPSKGSSSKTDSSNSWEKSGVKLFAKNLNPTKSDEDTSLAAGCSPIDSKSESLITNERGDSVVSSDKYSKGLELGTRNAAQLKEVTSPASLVLVRMIL